MSFLHVPRLRGFLLPGLFVVILSMNANAETTTRHGLFFAPSEVPALRERMDREPFATRWAEMRQRAEALWNEPPARGARYQLGNMGSSAFAYVITGDSRHADRAVREARAAIAQGRWIAPRHVSFNRGADLTTAELSLGLALVYDWCHEAMDTQSREVIRTALLEEGLRRYAISVDGNPREWWFEHAINNWRGVCHGGMGVAALALYDESPEARRLAEVARVQVPRIFEQVVAIDGGGHEGVGYHHYGITYATSALMALKHRFEDGSQAAALELMRERLAGYWDIYMQGPDLRYANIGRMGGDWGEGLWSRTGRGGPHAELCALFESVVSGGDDLLRWGADNGSSRFYWPGASPFWFLWRRDDGRSAIGAPRPELQPAVLFRGAGHAVLQSPRLWLAFSGGRTHNRRDLGAFVLTVDGERLIHIPDSNQATETRDQSTVLIDGRGQIRDTTEARYLRFGSGEDFHYLALDLARTYEAPAPQRFVRHLLMIRGDYLVLVDDLAASRPTRFEARIQTSRRQLEIEGNRGRIQGDHAGLHVLTAGSTGIGLTHGRSVLDYLAAAPAEPQTEVVLITVLYPIDGDKPPPAVAWTPEGELRVGEDRFSFAREDGAWSLRSVNGASAEDLPTGADRSLLPLRPGET